MSVTIKTPESERYKQDGTWFVFHGSPAKIREGIVETFALEVDPDVPLSDVAYAAQAIATAQRNVGGAGRSLPRGGGSSSSSTPAPVKEEEKVDPLVAEINNLVDLASHANTWADNKTRLQAEPEMLELWKAKGRELKAAA